MTAQAEVQPAQELGDDRWMSFAEAALRLIVSEAELCRLILSGQLHQVGRRFVDRQEVEQLAAQQPKKSDRMRRAPGQLPGSTETGLWYLADWAPGKATDTDLAAVMGITWHAAYQKMAKAIEAGLIERHDRHYFVTDRGWEYIAKFRRGYMTSQRSAL